MIYLGVDPGKSGAIVAIMPGGTIQHARNDWTEKDVSEWVADVAADKCYAMLEQVAIWPPPPREPDWFDDEEDIALMFEDDSINIELWVDPESADHPRHRGLKQAIWMHRFTAEV